MGRLIDADELLKSFAKQTLFGCGTVGIKFVDDLIKNQPTAYDIEKVVAELERLEYFADKYTTSKQGILMMAIDIVKRGGVE